MGTAIESEVPCIQCGYNLRTLEETGRCPECGAAIAFSVSDARHRLGIDFMRRAGRAAWWLGISNMLAVAGIIICIFLSRFLPSDTEVLVAIVFMIGCMGIAVLQVVAAWRCTVGYREPWLRWQMIWVIRVSALGSGLAMLCGLMLTSAVTDIVPILTGVASALKVTALILVPLIVPLILGLGWHYAAICMEIGDESNARANKTVSVMLATGLLVLVGGVESVALQLSSDELLGVVVCPGVVVGVLSYFCWTIVMFANGVALRDSVRRHAA